MSVKDSQILRECPFCGGEASTYSMETWWVSHACDCLGKYVGTKEYATEAEAIAAWNTRVLHSTLTADQVREAVLKRGNVMGPRFYGDWQAIADELNAAWNSRAERTCELTFDGTDGNFGCSECLENIPPLSNYCPSCGCKVIGG